jgi:hypothetical protein
LTDKPGSELRQIVHEIRRAGVVIAELTRHNPSVFYELGIAHQLAGTERVRVRGRPPRDDQRLAHSLDARFDILLRGVEPVGRHARPSTVVVERSGLGSGDGLALRSGGVPA